MATNQPACWRLIIGRAHDWEQFALPTFSSTKLLSDWIYSKQKHVRKWVLVGEERGTRVLSCYTFFPRKRSELWQKKQNRKMQHSEGPSTEAQEQVCSCVFVLWRQLACHIAVALVLANIDPRLYRKQQRPHLKRCHQKTPPVQSET